MLRNEAPDYSLERKIEFNSDDRIMLNRITKRCSDLIAIG
jgi:hypothetical protein